MNKTNGLLLIIVFFLIFIIAILSGYMYQEKQNERLMFERFETEVIILQEKNQVQDELIQSIIRNQAMAGMFDRKD